jgi:hypothetical protein
MRPSRTTQVCAAALALVFTLAGNRQVLEAGCPHHDGGPHGTPERGTATTPSHPASHRSDGVEERANHELPTPVECTCVGTCHAGAASPLPQSGAPVLPATADPSDDPPSADRTPHVTRLSHVLPYATAPPLIH